MHIFLLPLQNFVTTVTIRHMLGTLGWSLSKLLSSGRKNAEVSWPGFESLIVWEKWNICGTLFSKETFLCILHLQKAQCEWNRLGQDNDGRDLCMLYYRSFLMFVVRFKSATEFFVLFHFSTNGINIYLAHLYFTVEGYCGWHNTLFMFMHIQNT
jgi:hypothetical protein